jgi:hypothetical protein
LELALFAPGECGSAESIQAAVEKLVQRPPSEPLRAELSITRNPGAYEAELRTASAASRRVTGESCEAVIEAVTVILALAIDPSADPNAIRREKRSPEVSQGPKPQAPALLHIAAGARATFDSATLSRIIPGASLRAGVAGSVWSAQATATYWLPQTAVISTDSAVGGHFAWWTLGISGCLAPVLGAPRFRLCLEPELGQLQGTGRGTATDRTVSALWFAIALSPNLSLALSRQVVLQGGLGAAVTVLGRHSFVLQRSGEEREVLRPARISLRAALGLDVLF